MRWRALAAIAAVTACDSAEFQAVPTDAASDVQPVPDATPTTDLGTLDLGETADSSARDLGTPDLGTALDAADLGSPDAGAPVDAGSDDAGAEDAGAREVAFVDDFSTNPLEGTPPRWTITNFDANSWQWIASDRLQSGPGPSCVYWGNRLVEPAEPFCDEGPALIHSPAWDTGDGRFTVELAVRARTDAFGHRTILLMLHRGIAGAPGWDVDPTSGEPAWPGLERVFEADMVIGGDASRGSHLAVCDRFGAPCVLRDVPELTTNVWYTWRVEVCGDEIRTRIQDRDAGTLLFSRIEPLPVTVPSSFAQLQLVLGAEATGKDFDDVRVTRGCEGDPL